MTLSHSLASFRKFHKLVSNSNGHREKCLAVFVWGPFACMEYYFIFEVFFFFLSCLILQKDKFQRWTPLQVISLYLIMLVFLFLLNVSILLTMLKRLR